MEHQIKVISDFPVDTDITMGSVFYGVEHMESYAFGAVCKICDGVGKVNIRDREFVCPECYGKAPEGWFRGYAVRAFRVYGVELIEQVRGFTFERIQALQLVDADYYRKDMAPAIKRNSVRPRHIDMDREHELSYADVETAIFSNYRRAVAFADKLRAEEEKRMAEFNERYGTEHKLEWRIKDIQPPEEDGKCWGNGDCQDCPKAKWSSSSLFTEEPRVIGCTEDDGR